jgi:hypothetical protein
MAPAFADIRAFRFFTDCVEVELAADLPELDESFATGCPGPNPLRMMPARCGWHGRRLRFHCEALYRSSGRLSKLNTIGRGMFNFLNASSK